MYAKLNIIEKTFNNLKNELDNDRFLTHNQENTDAKSFVSFISVSLWSDIQRTVNKTNHKIERTIHRLLNNLKMIRQIDHENGSMLLQHLTKKQKDILDLFNIDQNIFIDEILNTKV